MENTTLACLVGALFLIVCAVKTLIHAQHKRSGMRLAMGVAVVELVTP